VDLDAGLLIAACSDESAYAGITIEAVLEPLGGPGNPSVKPAGFEGGWFQADRRWWGEGGDRRQLDVLVIESVPSQANRPEAALQQRRAELRVLEIVLDLGSLGALPPYLPRQIPSFRFPHRNARRLPADAMLNGGPVVSPGPTSSASSRFARCAPIAVFAPSTLQARSPAGPECQCRSVESRCELVTARR
jgi:hypothetical protein